MKEEVDRDTGTVSTKITEVDTCRVTETRKKTLTCTGKSTPAG